MNDKKKEKKWMLRVFKSDLPELKERINFLIGNSWDISIGIDGVEDMEGGLDDDKRMVITKVPENWVPEVIIEWLKRRIRSRGKVKQQLAEEMAHLQFVKELVQRQLAELKEK